MNRQADPPEAQISLRRALGVPSLLFYGLAVIVGAGIFVAIASVMARAGAAAPLSFLLAGLAAGMTGLCYAELASRFPEAAGAVAYVRQGFGSLALARIVAIALTAAVAISAASIASGAVHYLSLLIGLSPPLLIAMLVGAFTLLAMSGVRQSVGFAVLIGMIEIAALLLAAGAGFLAAPAIDPAIMIPDDLAGWHGVVSGAFIAFFAFIGFESLVNMAEEARDPRRTIPVAVLGAIAFSTLLYLLVATALVVAGPEGGQLTELFEGGHASLFAAIGAVSIASGVLVEIMMLSRLFFGMARRQLLPARLGEVHPQRRTPIAATAVAGALVLATALLVPFENLLSLSNALTLSIFVVVDLALWRIQRQRPAEGQIFSVPRFVPPLAAMLAGGLILAEIIA